MKSPHGMSPFGVGPLIYMFGFPFVFYGLCYPFQQEPTLLSLTAGFLLVMSGIGIFIKTMFLLVKHFNEGKLATTGAFRLSRNPLYSCWILLIIPGLAVFFLNWWILMGSVLMYVALNMFIKREETILERTFGQEYLDYKKKVGRLFLKI